MKTQYAAALALLTTLACAGGHFACPSPVVTIAQVSTVAPVRIAELPLASAVSQGVPVDYEIKVTNPFAYPLSLASVEIETTGPSGAYSMRLVRHTFSIVISPQSTAVLPIRAWVHPLQDTDTGDVAGPVILRGIAHFSCPDGKTETSFTARVQ